jgi:hypothetical protein
VYYKPFVDWIWGGCLLMALGGAAGASSSDKRYRLKARSTAGAGSAGMKRLCFLIPLGTLRGAGGVPRASA